MCLILVGNKWELMSIACKGHSPCKQELTSSAIRGQSPLVYLSNNFTHVILFKYFRFHLVRVVVAAAVVTVEAFLVVLDLAAAVVMMTQMTAALPHHHHHPVVLAHLPKEEAKNQQKMKSRIKEKMTMIK